MVQLTLSSLVRRRYRKAEVGHLLAAMLDTAGFKQKETQEKAVDAETEIVLETRHVWLYAAASSSCPTCFRLHAVCYPPPPPPPPQLPSVCAHAAARAMCEQCGAEESKYTCPGCQHRTCSLACVKQHKAASGCSGKRDRLAFVPLKDFDDRHLLSGEAPSPHATAGQGGMH